MRNEELYAVQKSFKKSAIDSSLFSINFYLFDFQVSNFIILCRHRVACMSNRKFIGTGIENKLVTSHQFFADVITLQLFHLSH